MQQRNVNGVLPGFITSRLASLRLAWRSAAQSDDLATMHITLDGRKALSDIAHWLESGSPDELRRVLSAPPWTGNDAGADAPATLLVALDAMLRDVAEGDETLVHEINGAVAEMSATLDALLRERIRRLEDRVATDPLTGADSREEILVRLGDESARSIRHGRPLGVVYIDADELKSLNTAQGHTAGDAMLKTLVRVVRANTRVTDAIGRLGGDEFLLVLPETDLHGAEFVARKLTELLAAEKVDVSAGAAGTPETRPEPDALIEAADAAMRVLKDSGTE